MKALRAQLGSRCSSAPRVLDPSSLHTGHCTHKARGSFFATPAAITALTASCFASGEWLSLRGASAAISAVRKYQQWQNSICYLPTVGECLNLPYCCVT